MEFVLFSPERRWKPLNTYLKFALAMVAVLRLKKSFLKSVHRKQKSTRSRLNAYHRGIVYGMHLAGASLRDIAVASPEQVCKGRVTLRRVLKQTTPFKINLTPLPSFGVLQCCVGIFSPIGREKLFRQH